MANALTTKRPSAAPSVIISTVVFLLGFLLGLFVRGRSHNANDRSPTVATFKGGVVTSSELQTAAKSLAGGRASALNQPTVRRQLLDKVVEAKLLAHRARADGFADRPDIRLDMDSMLARAYLRQTFELPEAHVAIPDSDVQTYYEQHKSEFEHPERIRIAQILIGPGTTKRSEAETVLRDAKAKEGGPYAFEQLARIKSEDPALRPYGGDEPAATLEEIANRDGQELAKAVESSSPGRVVPHLIEDGRGFHIVKVLGRDLATHVPLDKVKDTLRNRLAAERRTSARKAYLDKLQGEANLRVDEAALERVVFEGG